MSFLSCKRTSIQNIETRPERKPPSTDPRAWVVCYHLRVPTLDTDFDHQLLITNCLDADFKRRAIEPARTEAWRMQAGSHANSS